jgi:hypothetical protein
VPYLVATVWPQHVNFLPYHSIVNDTISFVNVRVLCDLNKRKPSGEGLYSYLDHIVYCTQWFYGERTSCLCLWTLSLICTEQFFLVRVLCNGWTLFMHTSNTTELGTLLIGIMGVLEGFVFDIEDSRRSSLVCMWIQGNSVKTSATVRDETSEVQICRMHCKWNLARLGMTISSTDIMLFKRLLRLRTGRVTRLETWTFSQ